MRRAGIAALASVFTVSSAGAGGMTDPIVEAEAITQPAVIAADSASSAPSPILLGLIALALVAAIASAGGGGGPTFD